MMFEEKPKHQIDITFFCHNRLLCELVRKRERLKAEYTRVWERCVVHALRPARAILHKLLRLLRQHDHSDVFSEPVDLHEVIIFYNIGSQSFCLVEHLPSFSVLHRPLVFLIIITLQVYQFPICV